MKAEHRRLLAISPPSTQSDSTLSDSKLSDSTPSQSSCVSSRETMVKVSPSPSYASSSTPATSATNGYSSSVSPRASSESASGASPWASSESLLVSEQGESRAELSGSLSPIYEFVVDTSGEGGVAHGASSRKRGGKGVGLDGLADGQPLDMPLRVKVPGAPAASDKEAAERMRTVGGLAQRLFEDLAKWRKCNRRLSRDRRVEGPIARVRERRRSAGFKRGGLGSGFSEEALEPSPPHPAHTHTVLFKPPGARSGHARRRGRPPKR